MDTRIKERLVGAIVLVAIVVIVVPELLTGQRAPSAPPSEPGTVPQRTVTIHLDNAERAAIAHPPPAAVPLASPAAAPAAEAPVAIPASLNPGPAEETLASPEPVAAVAAPPAATAEPHAVPAARAAVPAASLAPRAAPSATAAAKAPAAPPPAPPRPSSVAHGGEAWVVQLGSFASRENAERLASNLRTKRYSAYVSEFRGSGRVLFRVRVGPEQDRARADAIAARLAREGHRGSVAPES